MSSHSAMRRVRKALAASPAELGFRAWRLARDWLAERRYKRGAYQWPDEVFARRLGIRDQCGAVSDTAIGDRWTSRLNDPTREVPFPLNPEALQEAATVYGGLYPEGLKASVEAADRVLRGEFSFLGVEFRVGNRITWQRDPVTGYAWPKSFFKRVEISGNGQVDPKHVWELNRHEFLIDCGKAYRLSCDARYARHIVGLIDSWIEENPFCQGINWAVPLEVGVRALAWLWTLQFCRPYAEIPRDFVGRWIKAFYHHGYYLYRNLSFYASPYNHFIGEATALYLLGCYFPEFDESAAWRRRGWRVLSSQVRRQFHADGGSVEQATSYHCYCLGFYLLALAVRAARGQEVPQTMRDRLERAVEFLMWMTQPDGKVPAIGDMDDARSVRFERRRFWDFRNILAIGAVLFGRGDFKHVAGSFSEDAFWLFGRKGCDRFERLSARAPTSRSRLFSASGYWISRSGWGRRASHLCFDCGPIAAGLHANSVPSAAHGHADMLSFTLCAAGKPIIVDSGCFIYSGDSRWHQYFRDTRAHNTVVIDERCQARHAGVITWSHVPRPQPPRLLSGDGWELAACAYHTLTAVWHERAILWRAPASWFIVDHLDGRGRHRLEVLFHFDPNVQVDARNGEILAHHRDGAEVVLKCVQGELAVEVIRAGEAEPLAWVARSYGVRLKSYMVRFHGIVRLPVTLGFVCSASHPASPRAQRIEPIEAGNDNSATRWEVGCRVIRDHCQEIIVVASKPRYLGKPRRGGLRVHVSRDARVAGAVPNGKWDCSGVGEGG